MPIANAANEPRVDHTSAVACSGSGLDYNERAPASWVGGSDLTGTALFVRPLLRLKYKVRERGCCLLLQLLLLLDYSLHLPYHAVVREVVTTTNFRRSRRVPPFPRPIFARAPHGQSEDFCTFLPHETLLRHTRLRLICPGGRFRQHQLPDPAARRPSRAIRRAWNRL